MADRITLNVPDMSCGHCKAVVEKAIADTDAGAEVEVDLGTRTVAVESVAPAAALIAALDAAGYVASLAG